MSRIESDFLGEVSLEDNNYYGVQTKRALENFPITGVKTSSFPEFIKAFAEVKKATAIANFNLKILDEKIKDAIVKACDKIIGGQFHDQFIIDPIQGGAGTSMNMNANEVIANVALEVLGKAKGDYAVLSPNDHVNMGQSTNDSYPSSIKIATVSYLNKLVTEMKKLKESFLKKAKQYNHVVKVGRTQLQDAVPMTYGQAFTSYANQVQASIDFIEMSKTTMYGLNMGATAIGSGITAHKDFKVAIEKAIKEVVSKDFYVLEDLFMGTQDASGFLCVSGAIKRFAMQLSKICNDLRLLSSGPRAGFGEINLPAKQPGSSIMPGKVNPVIPEAVNQVCFQVAGFDTAIAFSAEGGQMELNAFEPLIAYNLFNGCNMLVNGISTLIRNCIEGIEVNEARCKYFSEHNISVVTNLKNVIGYKLCSKIARTALEQNKSVLEVAKELTDIDEAKLKELLDPKTMV